VAEAHDRFLSWRTVRDIAGISRSTAWRLEKAGAFPSPIPISPGRVGWRASELEAWMASRRAAGRQLKSPRAASPAKAEAPLPKEEADCGTTAVAAAPQGTSRPQEAVAAQKPSKKRRGPNVHPEQIGFDF
jgi:predicted DNA-binding transcriptional regulator AlpA